MIWCQQIIFPSIFATHSLCRFRLNGDTGAGWISHLTILLPEALFFASWLIYRTYAMSKTIFDNFVSFCFSSKLFIIRLKINGTLSTGGGKVICYFYSLFFFSCFEIPTMSYSVHVCLLYIHSWAPNRFQCIRKRKGKERERSINESFSFPFLSLLVGVIQLGFSIRFTFIKLWENGKWNGKEK